MNTPKSTGKAWDQLEEKVDNLVEALVKENKLPGMTVAVTKAGRLLLSKGYGYALVDGTRKLPIKPLRKLHPLTNFCLCVLILGVQSLTTAAAATTTVIGTTSRITASPPANPRQPFSITAPPASPNSHTVLTPTTNFTAKPFVHTHRVSATFSFEYERRQPDLINLNLSDPLLYPWKIGISATQQTRPIRSAIAVLEDDCGHYIKGSLSVTGEVSFDWTPAGCENATITVWSVNGSGHNVGVGRWIHGAINSSSELSANSGDYRPYSYSRNFLIDSAEKNGGGQGLNLGSISVPFEQDSARGFFIMDNVQTALNYYDTLPGVQTSELPKINVVHTQGLKPERLTCNSWDSYLYSAFYSSSKDPGFIFIPWDCNDLGRDGHAHVHETSHYFQRHFLRQDPDYGRFGEGMANLQAALIRQTQWISTTGTGLRTTGTGLLENIDVNSRMACWGGEDFIQVENSQGNLVDMRIDDAGQLQLCTDLGGTGVFPQAGVWDPALNNAGWFQRIVWDLVDAGAGEAEPVTQFLVPGQCTECEAGQFDTIDGQGLAADPATLALNDVLIHYLGGDLAAGKNNAYEDRGLDGLDLTDLIDGFICRGHISADQANAITEAMGLDFDAAGGPASCPHPED